MEQSKVPAWLGSVLLHVGVVLALIYVSFGPKLPPPMTGVPVTLVSNGPPASVQPEPQVAPQETAPPATPEPAPAPPTPAPPTPAPPKPTPKPQPTPPAPSKAGKTKPTPQKPSQASSQPFDASAAAQRDFGPAPSPPRRSLPTGPSAGPARFNPTAAQAGVALKGLTDKMSRLWVFDCSIQGNKDAVIPIHFVIGPNGRFSDGPTVVSGGSSLFAGAGSSAVRALKAGQPYTTDEVPPEYRNQPLTLNFQAKDACARK